MEKCLFCDLSRDQGEFECVCGNKIEYVVEEASKETKSKKEISILNMKIPINVKIDKG